MNPNCCNSYENILQLDRSYLAMEAFSRHVQHICFNPWCRTETRRPDTNTKGKKGPSAFDDLKSRRGGVTQESWKRDTSQGERERGGKKSGQISLDSRKGSKTTGKGDGIPPAPNDTSIGRDKLFRFSRNWISDFLPLPLEANTGSGNANGLSCALRVSSYCFDY